ncbi:MAG: M23 family metallopeptidase [Elusimicrobia bacterium]|nr:M23 family metallopeptidase [Elusimicrobiota bacterium]
MIPSPDNLSTPPQAPKDIFPAVGCFLVFLILIKVFLFYSLIIRYEPDSPRQGQALKIEIRGAPPWSRLACRFKGKTYPFYITPHGTRRALIPIFAEWKPKTYSLEIEESGWLRWRWIDLKIPISDADFPRRKVYLPTAKMALFSHPEASKAREDMLKALATITPTQLWKGTFEMPVQGKVTSPYGYLRQLSRGAPWKSHLGADLGARKGSEVTAANEGVVVLAARLPLQGGVVIINHGQGVLSAYMHMSKILIQENEFIRKGQRIGLVGSEGLSTAPHLHWGLYLWQVPIDPLEWTKHEF